MPLTTLTAKTIIRAINSHTKKNSTMYVEHTNWYIGITNNPQIRQWQHKTNLQRDKLHFFICFNARSRRISEAIEKYFHKMKMRGANHTGGARHDSKFVYVYKKHPTILD